MAEARIKIIHLSDLHFEAPLREAGRVLARPLGVRTHRYAHLLAAAPVVRREMFLGDADAVALCATGDFVTRGDDKSMILARKLLLNRHVPDVSHDFEPERGGRAGAIGDSPLETQDIGFFASRADGVIGVPGNHDRYSRTSQIGKNNHLFERVFAGDFATKPRNAEEPFDALPPDAYKVFPTTRVVATSGSSGIAAVFYCIDSNELSFLERIYPGTSIANGRVGEAAMQKIAGIDAELRKTGRLQDSLGKTYNLSRHSIIRVLVMHHHPVSVDEKPYRGSTVILNAQAVRSLAESIGCELVIFGHEHLACCKFNTSDLAYPIYAAAPSISVHDSSVVTGLNVFSISESHLQYKLYENDGGVLSVTKEHTFARSKSWE